LRQEDELMSHDKMKILAKHLHRFIEFGQVRNIPLPQMLGLLTSPGDFSDPASSVSVADFYKVLEFISRRLNDEQLGIRVGNFMHLIHLGAVYQISLKASTVEEALYYCQTYLRNTLPIAEIKTTTTQQTTTIEYSIPHPHSALNRIVLENTLVLVSREIREISGQGSTIQVTSPFYEPGYPSYWEKGNAFAVTFSRTLLKAASRQNSHWGLEVLIPEYLKIMESLQPDQSFTNQVKLMVLNMAKPDLASLSEVAATFHITPRTFQRRLLAEGTTFRQIKEALKCQISDHLLRHDRFSVSDIAFVLGYSEPASFIHSFTKWYKISPQKMRKGYFAG
jgi:AraC-like DNA-binding protein